jgi:hypothetical protein
MKSVCLSGLWAAVFVFAATSPLVAQDQSQPRKWTAFLDLDGKVGTQRSLGQADLFVPLWQDHRTLLFGDARFQIDDQGSWEGNWGIGLRHMLDGGWNIGGYGYYDHRRSPNANYFDQLTFGAELLGTNLDFRANSYWPVGDTVQQVGSASTGPSTAAVQGSTLRVSTPATYATMEYALRGFDAEAGVRIPVLPVESPYNLRFYAGGFRFDAPAGAASVVAGPRLRLEFTDYEVPELWHGTRFTVDAEWQTDEVRGSQFFAGLRLRVPLEAEPKRAHLTPQERRMTDPVVRDVDIVANTRTVEVSPAITETATATAGGQAITAISSSTTAGANLPTAVANAGANSLVVLQGTFNTTATTALQSGQTVMGSGSLAVRTASGRTVTVGLPGATIAATTAGGTSNPGVSMANNSTLTGITVTNTSSNGNGTMGVVVNGVNGATITNSTITGTENGANTAEGLLIFGSSSNIAVTNNLISGVATPGHSAIGLNVVSSSATVSGNTLTASGSSGSSNRMTTLSSATIRNGSTGNVNGGGVCQAGGTNTGTISFTDGTTCP